MSSRNLRRALRVTGGFSAALLACTAVGFGVVDQAAPLEGSHPSAVAVLFFASVVAVLISALTRRMHFEAPSARAQRVSRWMRLAPTFADLEVAFALSAATYALLSVTGGLNSDLYPLLYAVVAFSATFQTRLAAGLTVAAVIALELSLLWRTGSTGVTPAVYHLVFMTGAVAVHALFLRGLIAVNRRDHDMRVHTEVEKQQESARDYRLISVALGAESRAPRSRRKEEQILQAGSVATISSSIYHSLSLLHQALEARSCVLLWRGTSDSELKIKEVVSNCDAITEEPIVALSGVLKAVARDGKPLIMQNCKPGQISYYEGAFDAGAFMGIPVIQGKHLRGILCLDREKSFSEKERELAERGAQQVLVAIRSEQVFNTVEKAKYEHERFYNASALLCRALTMEQVQDTAFDAAAAIVDYDIAILTLHDADQGKHRVTSVRAKDGSSIVIDAAKLQGLEFRDNAGLASMVVKNKHYLPTGGAPRDTNTPVFTNKLRFQCESLLVLPLLSADEAIGTLTLASHRRGQFRKDVREMLGVISNQVAVSLQNALMYKRMETMATTDGLTGLTNHRSFQERFADLVERSQRHGHQAAMLLCDVDHFKNVNDTYGHPVGDEVLRRVAGVLQEATRKIDIPARYGGEEFAVVLEATDLEGALGLAERIREDVGAMVLDSDKGTFSIKMSIGVASFPADGAEPAELIEHADMSLYHAKENGRNQVVCYRDFLAARKARKAS
ncbi:MAG: sensor domain-containing diguanylate cyclase [Myxococcales bacterium]|nr:sensor domain-containing diguanylate cyclase [Myxococcales bacterium]